MIVFGTAIAMSAGMLAGCSSSKGGDSASVELNDAGTYPIVKDGTIDMNHVHHEHAERGRFCDQRFHKVYGRKDGNPYELRDRRT